MVSKRLIIVALTALFVFSAFSAVLPFISLPVAHAQVSGGWTSVQVLETNQAGTPPEPVTYVLPNGTVIMFHRTHANIEVVNKSTNGGTTWPDGSTVSLPISLSVGGPLNSVFWNGTYYIGDQYTSGGLNEELEYSSNLVQWYNYTTVPESSVGNQLAMTMLSNHTIWGVTAYNGSSIFVVKSTNGGYTWTEVGNDITLESYINQPFIYYNTSDSNFYIFANYGADGSQNLVIIQGNGGGTWTVDQAGLLTLPIDSYPGAQQPIGFFVNGSTIYVMYGLTDSSGASQALAEASHPYYEGWSQDAVAHSGNGNFGGPGSGGGGGSGTVIPGGWNPVTTLETTQNTQDPYPVTYKLSNGTVLLYYDSAGSQEVLYKSTTGSSWTFVSNIHVPNNHQLTSIMWNGSMYIGTAWGPDLIMYSTNLVNWYNVTQLTATQNQFNMIRIANGTYYGVWDNNNTDIVFGKTNSLTATAWTEIGNDITPGEVGLSTEVNAPMLYYNTTSDQFVVYVNYGAAGSQNDAIMSSSNGLSWSLVSSGIIPVPVSGYPAAQDPNGVFVLGSTIYLAYGLTDSSGDSQGVAIASHEYSSGWLQNQYTPPITVTIDLTPSGSSAALSSGNYFTLSTTENSTTYNVYSSQVLTITSSTTLTLSATSSGSSSSQEWVLQASGSVSIIPSATETVTYYYYDLYAQSVSYAIVDGGTGYSAPSFSYTTAPTAAGSSSNPAAAALTLTTTATTAWALTGTSWSVTPNPLTGSTSSERWYTQATLTGTATSAGTVDPAYYNQYYVPVSYSIVDGGTGYSAPTLTYYSFGTSTPYTMTTTATSLWMDANSWSVTNPLTGSGSTERWETNAVVSGTISGTSPIDPAYYNQYYITLSYAVIGGGTGYSAPTATGSEYGSSYSPTLTTTATGYWFDATGSVTFTNPLGGSSSSERWDTIIASEPATASGTFIIDYYNQYTLTASYSVSGGGSGYSAPTLTTTEFGSSYTPALTITATPYWIDSGSSWSLPNPLSGSSSSERWDTSATTSGTVSSASTISPQYYNQFWLNNTLPFSLQYYTLGTLTSGSPATGWADGGSTLTASGIASGTYAVNSPSWLYQTPTSGAQILSNVSLLGTPEWGATYIAFNTSAHSAIKMYIPGYTVSKVLDNGVSIPFSQSANYVSFNAASPIQVDLATNSGGGGGGGGGGGTNYINNTYVNTTTSNSGLPIQNPATSWQIDAGIAVITVVIIIAVVTGAVKLGDKKKNPFDRLWEKNDRNPFEKKKKRKR
ncbi:MAG: hypothetical protein M1388_01070 [Thaumarchaeota archaeon]|nr:hypothetical protein [Nitrososphaerota archaeon]